MNEKLCCGIFDFDGVLAPGEELIDKYVWEICKEASNAYFEMLYSQKIKLITIQQRLEQERNIYGSEMQEVSRELDEIGRKIKIHFELKDQVLEETEAKYRNRIPYKEIYREENLFQGVLELFWKIYESKVYDLMYVNTHVNSEAEIISKRDLLKYSFPQMKFIPVRYHIEPYRDPYGGSINKNRQPSDKIGRLIKLDSSIDVSRSTFVDNSASIIKRGKELGLHCYFVDKNTDPYIINYPTLNPLPTQVILQAVNDTIEREHGNKIKKLSL